MKRREFLLSLGVAGLMGMQAFACGCIGMGTQSGGNPSEMTSLESRQDMASPLDTDYTLAGTCPSGKSCISPGCHNWIDVNGDNKCDRGITGGDT